MGDHACAFGFDISRANKESPPAVVGIVHALPVYPEVFAGVVDLSSLGWSGIDLQSRLQESSDVTVLQFSQAAGMPRMGGS